jgi:catechol 2,3-dioxygenase-like lactoylglutathione lyase family enzyme
VLDHLGIPVRDIEASREFYLAALAPLGYSLLMQPAEHVCGFGRDGKPDFWIRRMSREGVSVHIAFAAADRPTVDGFHAAALAAGARDNGGPGVREIYHPHYYGAFVLDPDGYNVEAVHHGPA